MNKQLIIVLVFCFSNSVLAQIKSTNNLREYFFLGTIGNSEVSLNLFKGERPIYENGCFKKNLIYFEGNYQYVKNSNDLIFLFSKRTRIEDFDSDSLEFEEIYNKKITGIFKGVIRDSTFKGYWRKPESNEKLKFSFKQKETDYGISALKALAPKCDLEAKITFNESEEGQTKYRVINQSADSSNYYYLIEITAPYCRIYNCRGMCCGASDFYACLVKLNKNCTDLSIQKYRISNCDNFEDVSLTISAIVQKFNVYIEHKILERSYDSNKPEKGILLSK
jgi:hypothetical protein